VYKKNCNTANTFIAHDPIHSKQTKEAKRRWKHMQMQTHAATETKKKKVHKLDHENSPSANNQANHCRNQANIELASSFLQEFSKRKKRNTKKFKEHTMTVLHKIREGKRKLS
jgi:hypothetical protein